MSATINTLPAIRALLWERWRQVRWVVVVVWAVYGMFYFVYWPDGTQGPPPTYAAIEVIHAYGLPILILLGLVGIFAHAPDGRAFSFRLPAPLLRLPVSTPALATAQLLVHLAGAMALTGGLLAIDYLSFREDALVFRQPVMQLLLPVALLTVLLNVWLTLAPQVLSAVVAIPVTYWASGLMGWLGPDAHSLSAMAAALFGGYLLSVLAMYLARSHSTPTGQQLAAFVPAIAWPSRGIPKFLGPLHAMIWYEWRSWGRLFAGFSTGLALLMAVLALAIPGNVEWLSGPPLLASIVVAAALAFGVSSPARERTASKTGKAAFRWIHPVPTRDIGYSRLLGRGAILIVSLLAVMLINRIAAEWTAPPLWATPTAYSVIVVVPMAAYLFLFAWMFLNAGWPVLLSGCVFGVLMGSILGETAGIATYAIIVFGVALLCVALEFYGVMRWRQIIRVLVYHALFMALGTVPIAVMLLVYFLDDLPPDGFLGRQSGPMIALYYLLFVGASLWQLHWVHYCRHGGFDGAGGGATGPLHGAPMRD